MLRIDVLTKDGEATQYYSGGAVYAITPTTEAMARRAASLSIVAPITRWELPALAAPADTDITTLRVAAIAALDEWGDHEEPLGPLDDAMSALAALLSGSGGATMAEPAEEEGRGLETWGE